jgi:hypothetical protein
MALEHKANPPAYPQNLLFGNPGKIKGLVPKDQGSLISPFQKINTPQKGGFPRTAWADDGNHVSLIHPETEAVKNHIFAKGLFYSPYLKHIFSSFSPLPSPIPAICGPSAFLPQGTGTKHSKDWGIIRKEKIDSLP